MMVRMARSKDLQGQKKSQRQERIRIARSLLDVITDDRLLAEKTGLSEAEARRLREEKN